MPRPAPAETSSRRSTLEPRGPNRAMIGPVLYLEMLLGSRRGRQYVFRWVYAGWLLLQLCFILFMYYVQYLAGFSSMDPERFHPNTTAEYASWFVEIFVVQQMVLLLLATPAFTAGAIT